MAFSRYLMMLVMFLIFTPLSFAPCVEEDTPNDPEKRLELIIKREQSVGGGHGTDWAGSYKDQILQQKASQRKSEVQQEGADEKGQTNRTTGLYF